MKPVFRPRVPIALLGLCLVAPVALAQTFTASALNVGVANPTSLQFGPDGRLYVSEQYGRLHAFSIVRNGPGAYVANASETIDQIRNIANHDDDGGPCTAACTQRQVTGLLVAGSATHPVLYVTSSDSRVSVSADSGLDTNSGILTRLTCTGGIAAGQCQAWQRVDIVRGLPRSEENHATNGMALDAASNTLYIASGGNTNQGAPSDAFSGTTEYFLSGALLSLDLDAIAAIEAANGGPFTDLRSGTRFVHDLLTLDDPARANIDRTHADFPYAAGHPWRERSIDAGDPFGGNNGHNQALTTPGGPLQIHSPGYRNPYDVLLTASGRLYTWDNGSNSGWGGTPWLRDTNGVLKGYSTQAGVVYNPAAGDYCTNELNENGSNTHSDGLHLVGAAGYYGGHPAPLRAFPNQSGIHRYVKANGHWNLGLPLRFLGELLPAGFGVSIADYPNDPRQCAFQVPAGALEIVTSSTNGMAEYRASNFDGAMRGDLLAASFNGNIYRCKPDAGGGLVDLPGASTGTSIGRCEVLLGGFGSMPLDVTTQPDSAVFPGTIWAATYGESSITVFEPASVVCDPQDPLGDADGDGYTNGDEIANGTNPCSAGSQPNDFDLDLVSDLNDADDDNDSIADIVDAFALDPDNGLATALPLFLPLFNNDPGTGLFGLGLTGLMLPRDGSTTWLQLFDPEQLAAGGTAGLLTVEAVLPGDALGAANSQSHGFLVGIAADAQTLPFVASARLRTPWFALGGATGTPQPAQGYGLFIGSGDQDNYLKIVIGGDGSGAGQVRVTLEVAGSASTQSFSASSWGGSALLGAGSIDLLLAVDPQAGAVQPGISLDGGPVHALGSARMIPPGWLSGTDAQGLALGAISTSGPGGAAYGATWDHFRVAYTASGAPGVWTRIDDFDQVRHEGGFVQAGLDFHVVGGRESSAVRSWSPETGAWRAGAASPILLHHFQAVELDGLVYVVGAMTGSCCSEPPAPNVYLYDAFADRWSSGPAMPAGRMRGGGGAVAVDGRIYWISGNTRGHEGPVSALVDVFDPATGRFTALSPIPHPRDHFFVAHHAGKIYAVGGRDSNAGADGDIFDDTIAEVDVYDIASNSWTRLPPASNLPTLRAAAASGIVGSELIVAGGESSALTSAHPQTEALDLNLLSWRTLAPMRTPRHATQAIVSNNGLYVVAGSSLRGGPTGTPLDLEALHLFGVTPPTGTAITSGSFSVPASLDFGQVASGSSALRQLRLTHTGGNQAVIIDALVLGANANFRLLAPPLLPFVLAPGTSIDLTIEFLPAAGGISTSTLDIGSPGRAPQRVTLSGEGTGSGVDSIFADGFEDAP